LARIILDAIVQSIFYDNFNPTAAFEYWTAVVTTDFENIPEGMVSYNQQWLLCCFLLIKVMRMERLLRLNIFLLVTSSEYVLDHRPHFEILGDKYKMILILKKKFGFQLN
jgi:AraC family transcriptional regulator